MVESPPPTYLMSLAYQKRDPFAERPFSEFDRSDGEGGYWNPIIETLHDDGENDPLNILIQLEERQLNDL